MDNYTTYLNKIKEFRNRLDRGEANFDFLYEVYDADDKIKSDFFNGFFTEHEVDFLIDEIYFIENRILKLIEA